MALRQSDILVHNNPNLAVVDGDFVKGGFRTAVASVNDLYALSGKTDEPSAAGQLKEHATFVYVTGETKYYELIDINNVGNASGWQPFVLGGDGVTGATNGLTKVGNNVVLGGALNDSTFITNNNKDFLVIDNTHLSGTSIFGMFGDLNCLGISYCDYVGMMVGNNLGDISSMGVLRTDGDSGGWVSLSDGRTYTYGYDHSGIVVMNASNGFNTNTICLSTSGITIRNSIDCKGVMYYDDYSANYVSRSLVDKEYVDNRVISLTGVTSQAITGATNGLTKVGNDVGLGGMLNYSTSIHLSGNTFDFVDANAVHSFANDCVSFTVGCCPTALYINGWTDSLCFRSNCPYMCIGGNDNSIDIGFDNGGYLFMDANCDCTYIGSNNGAYISVDGGTDIIDIKSNNYGTYFRLIGGTDSIDIGSNDGAYISVDGRKDFITLSNNTGTEKFRIYNTGATYTSLNGKGIEYASDYGLTFTNRSLVDKEYVDGEISGVTLNAANGLTKVGNDVVLGGTLTGGTTIELDNNFFSITNACAGTPYTAFNILSNGDSSPDSIEICTASGAMLYMYNDGGASKNDEVGLYTACGGGFTAEGVYDTSSIFTNAGAHIDICGVDDRIDISSNSGSNPMISLIGSGATSGITLTGAIYITPSPSVGSIVDSVLVRTGSGIIKTVNGTDFGKNNIYSFSAVTSNTTLTTGSTYVILANPSAEITITLPAIPINGQAFKIKDISGQALTYNVIINGNGKNIDGNATAVINTNYGALELMFNSNAWFGLSFFN